MVIRTDYQGDESGNASKNLVTHNFHYIFLNCLIDKLFAPKSKCSSHHVQTVNAFANISVGNRFNFASSRTNQLVIGLIGP